MLCKVTLGALKGASKLNVLLFIIIIIILYGQNVRRMSHPTDHGGEVILGDLCNELSSEYFIS